MTTHTISYFKNHALSLLDAVAAEQSQIMITRRGKPLAQVVPVKTDAKIEIGKLKGTMDIRDDNDIVSPMGAKDWRACQ